MRKQNVMQYVSVEKLFKLIRNTTIIYIFVLTLICYFFPAKIGPPKDLNTIDKTLKAAWFLVWVQELISYSISFVYILYLLLILFFLLPYLSKAKDVKRAMWFPRYTRNIQLMAGLVFFIIFILWIIGMFFRGENWQIKF